MEKIFTRKKIMLASTKTVRASKRFVRQGKVFAVLYPLLHH